MKHAHPKQSPFWVRSKSGTQNAWIALAILETIGIVALIFVMASRFSQTPSYDDWPIWMPMLICIMPGILISSIIFISTGFSKAQLIRENIKARG